MKIVSVVLHGEAREGIMALLAADTDSDDGMSIFEQVHAQTVRAPLTELADGLYRLLTGRLTAYITGVKDARTVSRWASGEITDVRIESERRLRAAYEIMALLSRFDGQGTVRAWFIGMNPTLGDDSPADAIHDGRFQEAMSAARNFIAYG